MEDVDRLFHWTMEVLLNVILKQNTTAAQNGVIVEAQMSIVIVQIVLIIAKMMHQVYNSCHLTIFKMSIRITYKLTIMNNLLQSRKERRNYFDAVQ